MRAAKAGLIGLTRVVAHDLARSGIRCNAVAPFAATRVTESIKPANDAQAAYKEKALKVPAAYVARLVSFLASDCGRGDQRPALRRARAGGVRLFPAASEGAGGPAEGRLRC